MASNCSSDADQRFGPALGEECRGGFDFTLLFEQAILGLVPAALFLVVSPFRFAYVSKQDVCVRSGPIRLAKLAVAVVFGILQLVLLIQWSLPATTDTRASIASAAINLVVALQLAALSWVEHSRSVRPSTLLSVYLGTTILCDLPQARTLWLQETNATIASLYLASLLLKGLLFVLEVLEKRRHLLPDYSHLPPESTSGIVNRSFLWWLNDIFRRGFYGRLNFDELYELDDHLAADPLNAKVQRAWASRRTPERRLEFVLAVCRALLWPLLSMVPSRLCLIAFTFAQPFLFQRILTLLSEPAGQRTASIGYGLTAATGLLYLGLAVLRLDYSQKVNRFKTMFRGAAVSLIYDRTLLLQDGLYDESAAVTLMSTDVDNISSCLTEINECWARTVEVVLGIVLLADQLGWVCVMPIVLVIASFFGAREIAKRIGSQQRVWVDAVQKRIALTSSVLTNMLSFRMMGLMRMLTKAIQDQRVEETQKMKGFRWSIAWQNVVQNLPWALAPALTFIIYAAQPSGHGGTTPISTSKAFTSLSIITLLTDPAAKLLSAIPSLAASIGCTDRIQKFLTSPQDADRREVLDALELGASRADEGTAISLDGVDARVVGAQDSILHDVTFRIQHGSFTMVVGPIASGKSTLLKTILGETIWERGTITVSTRRVAYCSQTPWLPSTSIKTAICGPFDRHPRDFDDEWYKSVLRACALDHDLSLLPVGDDTHLGSGSTVLSGGQKQRVALARAIYSRADILILDDVFSALDRKTQRAVAEAMFGPEGLFKKLRSTVVLATHAVEYLSYADKILVLKEGRIDHDGTYEQLVHAGITTRSAVGDRHADDDTKAVDVGKKSSQVADMNEVNDLNRQTGDAEVYKYYFKAIGWAKLLTFVAFSALHVFAVAFSHIWLKWYADDSISQVGVFTAVYALLAVLNAAGIFGYAWSMLILITPSVAKKLHYVLLKTVMNAPQSFFSVTEAGAILNRFSQDMSLIETPLSTGVLVTITNLLGAAAEVALIATGSVWMTVTIPFLIVAVYGLQHVYLRTSRQLRLLDIETRSPLYSHFIESLDGLATIRSFGWTVDAQALNHERLDASQRPYYLMSCIQSWLELVLDLIVAAEAVLVVGLAIGLRTYTSAGLLGVSLNNIMSFNGSLSSVVSGWTLLETSLGSIARLRDLEKEVQPESKPEEASEPPPHWPSEGAISFANVDASHNRSTTTLHNLSLQIKPGQKVGICGRTGSGKSSLIATILRLLEIDNGSITIDGQDLSTLPRNTIRESIVTVPQHAPVLNGSVRLNVDPSGTHSDADITRSLRQVKLWTALSERGGLDAEMTESSLSHGQWQLLSLARAILNKGKILLLDEPTSSIDVDTDEIMKGVLRDEFAECTVLTVAHRINTIYPGSDVIVVVDEGRLVEVGEPEALLKKGGKFAQLAGR